MARRTIYEETKDKILLKIIKFHSTDNLLELAEALQPIQEMLEREKFPIEKYLKWLQKQKQESSSLI